MSTGSPQCLKLIQAVQSGSLEQVQQILQKCAVIDLGARDPNDKRTCLHIATISNNLEILKLLTAEITKLGKKEFLDAMDNKGKTALHFAVQSGFFEISEHLINCGCNVDAQNIGGQTALHYAVFQQYPSIVKLLLANGANVNLPNIEGQTALHYAAQVGNFEIVKILIDHKINVNALTKDNLLPIHFAVAYQHEDVVALLLNYHAIVPNSVLEIETSPNIDKMLDDYIMGVLPPIPTLLSKPKLSVKVNVETKVGLPAVLQTPMTPINLTTPTYAKENPFNENTNNKS
jgi:ankyrin repeat protein